MSSKEKSCFESKVTMANFVKETSKRLSHSALFLTFLERLPFPSGFLSAEGANSSPGRNKMMKRVLIGTFLMGVLGIGSAMGQDGWRDRDRDRQDIRNDYRDI